MLVPWLQSAGIEVTVSDSLRHQPDVYDVPETLTLFERGILWAGRSKCELTPDLMRPKYPSK